MLWSALRFLSQRPERRSSLSVSHLSPNHTLTLSWFWYSVGHLLITHRSFSHCRISLTWVIQLLILHAITLSPCTNFGLLFIYTYSFLRVSFSFSFHSLCGDVFLKCGGSHSIRSVHPLHAVDRFSYVQSIRCTLRIAFHKFSPSAARCGSLSIRSVHPLHAAKSFP
jgi:hypothetical protein